VPLTPEEQQAAYAALLAGPKSASGDTGSYTEWSPDELAKLRDLAAEAEITATPSANGGPKSGLRFLRPARVGFGGAYR
jgi:hypothetical protein